MESVVSQFAYNILQTLLADTAIYNFLKAYPKDQWSVLIRLLTFYSIKSVLTKYRKPPDLSKLQSFCVSSYDSNSPYLLKEKINDIHNKLLSIDKQLLEIAEVPSMPIEGQVKIPLQIRTQNLVRNGPLGMDDQVMEEISKNLRGVRSASSSRLHKSGMKHSMLIPQCRDVPIPNDYSMTNTDL
eukprot:TRINITY_DN8927_c0_g1_i2.p1 TRINITY_DN8927_c0_g1~~TRINITY_DN8927_c0_g1_i2.p1  ORF type:complete len:184 (-),score=42.15 TRINITY_DN8927_c0_g1_i2:181-732(-)